MADTGTPSGAVHGTGRLRRLVFGAVLVISFLVLFTPAPEVPEGPDGVDKVVHFALFAALAVSGRYAGLPGRWLVPALLVYAGVSEPLQSLPGIDRSTSLTDWVADALGVTLGYVGTVAFTRARSASRSSSGSG
jgi:VanZ family protein